MLWIYLQRACGLHLCVAHQDLCTPQSTPSDLPGTLTKTQSQRSCVAQEEQTIHCVVELEGTHTRGQTVCDWGCFDGLQAER